MRRFVFSAPGFRSDFAAFLAEPRGSPDDVEQAVIRVIDQVRTEGARALIRLTRQFDGVELTEDTLRVSTAEIEDGAARSGRWTRSSGRATPMSPPPSAGCTEWWGSTPWPVPRRWWWWPTPPTIRPGSPPTCWPRPSTIPTPNRS